MGCFACQILTAHFFTKWAEEVEGFWNFKVTGYVEINCYHRGVIYQISIQYCIGHQNQQWRQINASFYFEILAGRKGKTILLLDKLPKALPALWNTNNTLFEQVYERLFSDYSWQ